MESPSSELVVDSFEELKRLYALVLNHFVAEDKLKNHKLFNYKGKRRNDSFYLLFISQNFVFIYTGAW